MPYDLIADGTVMDLGDRKYLLSPQDLAGLDVLPELVKTGVTSLKIEGRLKSPEYVANVTHVYRQALDRIEAEYRGQKNGKQGLGVRGQGSEQNSKFIIQNSKFSDSPLSTPADRYNLEMAFSRGIYTGWFRGINNQELVHARFGKNGGLFG